MSDDDALQTPQEAHESPPGYLDGWWTFAESLTRITMVGLAGSMVGLAKERQMATQQDQQHAPKTQHRKERRTRPPTRVVKSSTPTVQQNLPVMWSISCMLFGIILETSRRSSPTTNMLEQIAEWKDSSTESIPGNGSFSWELVRSMSTGSAEATTTASFEHRAAQKALVSFGDYFIGGTVAGLAGALAQLQRHFTNPVFRRPTLVFGIMTGIGLGAVAGICQASVDVLHLYVEEYGPLEDRINEERVKDISKRLKD